MSSEKLNWAEECPPDNRHDNQPLTDHHENQQEDQGEWQQVAGKRSQQERLHEGSRVQSPRWKRGNGGRSRNRRKKNDKKPAAGDKEEQQENQQQVEDDKDASDEKPQEEKAEMKYAPAPLPTKNPWQKPQLPVRAQKPAKTTAAAASGARQEKNSNNNSNSRQPARGGNSSRGGRSNRGGRSRRGQGKGRSDNAAGKQQMKPEKDNKQGEDKQVKQKEEVTLVPAKQPSVNAWGSTAVATVEAATTEEKGNKQVWPTLKDAVVEESDSAPNASTQSTPAQKKV